MNLDEALLAFITESRDLLEKMEEALLRIEQQPPDSETINAIFRAAHTIKGSAGIFGLNDIVAFTHVAENVLDEVRKDRIRFDAHLANVFLAVGDHIRTLVGLIADGQPPDGACLQRGDDLIVLMEARLMAGALAHAGHAPTPTSEQTRDDRSVGASMLRVDAAKLDRLIDLVGELIIAGRCPSGRTHAQDQGPDAGHTSRHPPDARGAR